MSPRPRVTNAMFRHPALAGLALACALVPATAAHANGALDWTAFDTPTIGPAPGTPGAWGSVAYGDGTFVAVGAHQPQAAPKAMTSTDGASWVQRTSADSGSGNESWTAVAYGNGRFVAVSRDSGYRAMTSTDGGITWAGHAAAPQTWTSVAYGDSTFVAVSDEADGDDAMTSPDGETWSVQPNIPEEEWTSVAHGNRLFVAVAGDPDDDAVMTSPDGINWTARTAAGDDDQWQSVTYGNGLFVAVSRGGDRVMTSSDGINWTARTAAGDDDQWQSVTYGNGLFVAVASAGDDQAMTSVDGITWTTQPVANGNGWWSVASGAGKFVAVALWGSSPDENKLAMTRLAPEPSPEPSPEPTPAGPGASSSGSAAPAPTPMPIGRFGVTVPYSLARAGLPVSSAGTVGLPLACPPIIPGGICDASGVLSMALPRAVEAQGRRGETASRARVLARFRGVEIEAGKRRLHTVRLAPRTYRVLRSVGIRRVPATLTTTNRLTSGAATTSRERVWLRIAPLRVAVTG